MTEFTFSKKKFKAKCDYCGGWEFESEKMLGPQEYYAVKLEDENAGINVGICIKCFKKVFDHVLENNKGEK